MRSAEGLSDSFWTSDEYGPYIYLFNAEGDLVQAIEPPQAIVPFIDGKLNFTSDTDPDTGRAGNQGVFLTTSSSVQVADYICQDSRG